MSIKSKPVRTCGRSAEPWWRRVLGGIAAFALACAATPAARAEDVADFYRGKTIELLVGASAGGTYDTYARALTRHLTAHMPGNPNIIVKNVPGAGGLVAARTLYVQAPKDGTVIGTIMRGAVMEPLLGDAEKAKFDSRKFNFLASASTANDGTCIVRSDAKVQTFQQVFNEPVIVGSSARGSAIGDMPRYVNNLLKTKFKIVAGYNGTPDTIIAFERGEIEGICGLQYRDLPRQIPSWSQGKAKVIVQLGMRADDEMSKRKIPVIWDFISNPDDRTVLELIFGQLEFGRPFLAPPDVPADRVAALRKAFSETFKDPQFLADVERLKLELDPRSGEEVQALVEKLFAAPQPLVARAREVVE
jgi:tripartite-type tricarboxylate transporter receptor subunit TctC